MGSLTPPEPSIQRSLTLNFVGDWGQVNFHRICSWLTQEFCDRTGPRSRVAIWSMRGGGVEVLQQVYDGEAHLAIATTCRTSLGCSYWRGSLCIDGADAESANLGGVTTNRPDDAGN